MSSEELLRACEARFADAITDRHANAGDATIVVNRDRALSVFRTLRDDPELAFEVLVDLTAVDYLGRTPRFEVVSHLLSMSQGHRLRVKVPVPEEDPAVASLTSLWKAADWLEREAWDMFGIRFQGHPDLRRILMYPEFEGHPLRKDYSVQHRQPLVPERDPIDEPWERS